MAIKKSHKHVDKQRRYLVKVNNGADLDKNIKYYKKLKKNKPTITATADVEKIPCGKDKCQKYLKV